MWTVSRRLSASPEAAWQVLTDLDAWPRWGPSVTRAELDGADQLGQGVSGRVWTPLGVSLPFELTVFEPGRSWAWRVAGVPATTHGVEPEASGCRIWMGAPAWAPGYLPVLALALRRIDVMTR
jgi:uncharacterized protein YndB with AHSA1/START domain